MHIQQSTMAFTQGSAQKMGPPAKNDQINGQQRPPEGPPNGMPPGLDAAVSSLSNDQQAEVESALANLSDEQKMALKDALDDLKPQAEKLSLEEIGGEFLNILTQLTQESSDTESEYQVDTYI